MDRQAEEEDVCEVLSAVTVAGSWSGERESGMRERLGPELRVDEDWDLHWGRDWHRAGGGAEGGGGGGAAERRLRICAHRGCGASEGTERQARIEVVDGELFFGCQRRW